MFISIIAVVVLYYIPCPVIVFFRVASFAYSGDAGAAGEE